MKQVEIDGVIYKYKMELSSGHTIFYIEEEEVFESVPYFSIFFIRIRINNLFGKRSKGMRPVELFRLKYNVEDPRLSADFVREKIMDELKKLKAIEDRRREIENGNLI